MTDQFNLISQQLAVIIGQLEDLQSDVTKLIDNLSKPKPPPPDDNDTLVTVISPKANAWYPSEYNKAGVPIMQIYPNNNAATRLRVQWKVNDQVSVKPYSIIADGGARFFEIAEETIRNVSGQKVPNVKLYLRAKDVSA